MLKATKAVVLLAAAALAPAGPALAADRHVSVSGITFQPRTALALPGDRVVWRNTDFRTHNVTFSAPLPSSGAMANGAEFSHTFGSVGTFDYRCTIHAGMNGSVVVRDVHLSGPPTPVLYGRQATFTGLAPALSTVELHGSAGKVAEASAGSDGRFSISVAVHSPGRYHAVAGPFTSADVRVAVRAKVAISGRRAAGRLIVRLSTKPAQRGATVALERRKRTSWARIARARLNARSQAAFRVAAPRKKVAVRARLVRPVGGYTANVTRAIRL